MPDIQCPFPWLLFHIKLFNKVSLNPISCLGARSVCYSQKLQLWLPPELALGYVAQTPGALWPHHLDAPQELPFSVLSGSASGTGASKELDVQGTMGHPDNGG